MGPLFGTCPCFIFRYASLVERYAGRIITAYLKLAMNTRDSVSFARIYDEPNRDLGMAGFRALHIASTQDFDSVCVVVTCRCASTVPAAPSAPHPAKSAGLV